MSNLLRRLLLIFAVVISGALCTVEDYVIMSQCAHNKAIHLAAEGTVSVTDISQTQNITILGLPDFVNNAFKIALYAKETQRYLCFSENWRLVALKELQNTCYFNETIVHGYFVFRSVVDLQRRIGFTHRGKAVGPKKNVNDACYLFTKIQADEFFHQHNNHFAQKTTAIATATTTATATAKATTTMAATSATLPSSRLKMQRNKNKRRNNNSSNNNQNQQQLNGHNSNISSNLSSNKQQQKQPQQQQHTQQENQKLVLEEEQKQQKQKQHFKSHNHHHHHHEKHHQVRHHHNNPDVIARRQQHEQKQKRRPHNRLRMLTTSTSTSTRSTTSAATVASTPLHVDPSTTLSQRTQTAFMTSTLATTPSQIHASVTTSITPKVTSNNSKLQTTSLLPRTTSRTMTTTTSKRKGRRRKHKKHTHKKQKLQQQSKFSEQLAADKHLFATEENESEFSSSSLTATTWNDFTSMTSFLDEATSFNGNDWLSSSAEESAVSPTASLSYAETSLSTSYSSPTPLDESTNVASTTHSINKRKKSQPSKIAASTLTSTSTLSSTSDIWSPETFYDEMESTLNGLLSLPAPTVALPKMKSITAYKTKVNLEQQDLAATTTETAATSTSSNKHVNLLNNRNKSYKLNAINVTFIGESSTAFSNNINNKNAESTTTQDEVTPTLISNTIIDVNLSKWLTSAKGNHSNIFINDESNTLNNNNIDKNISINSMTEFINSTRSSSNTSIYQNVSNLQQYQQRSSTPISFSEKNNSDDSADITTLSTKRTTKQTLETTKSVQKSTTLSPLLQLFSPYYVTKSNNLMAVEKNINNGNFNNSILEEKTPTTTTALTKAKTTYLTTPMSISPTPTPSPSPSITSSMKKTIRKSTQKLLATPFHQLTTYVRNEAGDIDIDNIDNISVYPDLMDSETLTEDIAQLKKHQQQSNNNNNNNNTNSRLIVVSGYLPTSASAILPESIQIAKIKINNERQRLWPQRSIGNQA